MFSCCFYLFLLPLPLYLKLFTCNDNAFKYIQIVRSLREAKLGYLLVPKYHYAYVRNNGLTPPSPTVRKCTHRSYPLPPSPCVRTKWMPPYCSTSYSIFDDRSLPLVRRFLCTLIQGYRSSWSAVIVFLVNFLSKQYTKFLGEHNIEILQVDQQTYCIYVTMPIVSKTIKLHLSPS